MGSDRFTRYPSAWEPGPNGAPRLAKRAPALAAPRPGSGTRSTAARASWFRVSPTTPRPLQPWPPEQDFDAFIYLFTYFYAVRANECPRSQAASRARQRAPLFSRFPAGETGPVRCLAASRRTPVEAAAAASARPADCPAVCFPTVPAEVN